eukprot:scaffold249979_cov56-Prasinocladus_malaysianus.AAC.1
MQLSAGLMIYWAVDVGRCFATEEASLACQGYETANPGHEGDGIGSLNWTMVTASWPYPYAENETEWALCYSEGL